MAKNLIHFSSLSSTSNESIDVPTESNLELNPNSHRIKKEHTTYVSPQRIPVHSGIDYIPPPPGFPPKRTTTVETTHLLTPTSTTERLLGSSSRSATGHDIFPTIRVPFLINKPMMNYQEALDLLNQANLPKRVKEEANFHESNPSCINHGLRNFDQTAVVLGNPDNPSNVHRNVKNEPIFHQTPSYNNQGLGDFDQQGLVLGNPDLDNSNATAEQAENHPAGSDRRSEVDADDDQNGGDDDDPIETYDGRTHSLPHGPEGVYACPKCQVTCQSSQFFAAHIRSHYRMESEKAKNIRMAARYQRRNFRRQRSRYGITSIGISRENTAGRNSGISVNVERVDLRNTPVGAAPPRRGAIKEEPILLD